MFSRESSELKDNYETKSYKTSEQTNVIITYKSGYKSVATRIYKLYREQKGVLPKAFKELEYTENLFYEDIRHGNPYPSGYNESAKFLDTKLEKFFFNNDGKVVRNPNLVLENNVPIMYYYLDFIAEEVRTYRGNKIKGAELASLKVKYEADIDHEIALLRKLFDAGLDPNLKVENYQWSYNIAQPYDIYCKPPDFPSMLFIIRKLIAKDYMNVKTNYQKRTLNGMIKKPQHLLKMELQKKFFKQIESLIVEYGGKI